MRPSAERRGATSAVVAIVCMLLVTVGASAGVVTQHYEFTEPTVKSVDGFHIVSMPGAWSFGAPGEPVLPMTGATLLLPPGEVVRSITVHPGELVTLGSGYLVEPGQPQRPLSSDAPLRRVEPDPALYRSATPVPGRLHDEPTEGLFRGYSIASFALHPVEYIPADGTLSYYRSVDVEVVTAPASKAVAEIALRDDAATLERLDSFVDNPRAAEDYRRIEYKAPISRALDSSLGYKYIIVTTDSWDDYLGDLVDYETQRGHKAGLYLLSWITSNYTGVDDQEKIRNFIIDAYNTWGIDYVLLVGDAMSGDGIPHRGLWNDAYGESEYDIPADTYYGSLDGTWDTDGDGVWGEYSPEEADLYPDVAVGRACVSNVSDVQNFVTKTMRYTTQPIVSECDEALMLGELLWDTPLTYGGDYQDEVKDGSSANGYATVGFPGTMNVGTLYDKDATWAASTLINMMESGLNIVSHLGHCNTIYAMKMTTSSIPNFDNDGTVHSYNFVYSQGCYAGAFDNRTTDGTYTSECYAEEFACDEDGAVAVIMNGRYGWGDPGGTNGSSQYFNREFFDAMFAEGIYAIGDANDDSKVDAIWAITYGANRWCHYELNVFGDPALHLWTAEPGPLSVSYPSTVIIDQPEMTVTVSDGGGIIEGARVTVYTDDYSSHDSALTDASGEAIVHPYPAAPGTLRLKVTAHDHLDYSADIAITGATGPFVVYESSVVDDDTSGDSDGNGNGVVNSGESIELPVTLENVGISTATGVTATLSSTSPHVTITDDTESFGDIAPDATALSLDDFDFDVSGAAPDGELIPLVLSVTSTNRDVWESNFSLVVSSPVIVSGGHSADDSPGGGNGNGCVEAGETITISLGVKNTGSVMSTNVVATLSSTDPYVIMNDDSALAPFLNPDGSKVMLVPDFSVTILPGCPGDHEIVFDVDVDANWGYETSMQFSVVTGGGDFSDDVESGEGELTHEVVTPGFNDEWHIETARYNSSGHSWKCGGSGTGDYTDSSDGALYMATRCIGSGAALTFWDWLDAEEEGTGAWDGCVLQISTDGGASWELLYPDGGYTHTVIDNPANPLPTDTPCWSGAHGWQQESFDLSAYEGETAQIRFRFCSDGYVTAEGWYVDDIQYTTTGAWTGVGDQPEPGLRFALAQNEPNPFNPTTVIHYELRERSHVKLVVYDVAGRVVRTVLDDVRPAGAGSVLWDGTNASGEKVASGVYMYRMEAGDFESRRMMVLLK